jgi:hypothetical protein
VVPAIGGSPGGFVPRSRALPDAAGHGGCGVPDGLGGVVGLADSVLGSGEHGVCAHGGKAERMARRRPREARC